MKKLYFKKELFVRHPEKDFSDDGNYFRVLYYKNQLPISVLHSDGRVYADIRLDYINLDWRQYKVDYATIDEFNGVDDEDFNMDKFIANCEAMFTKYVLNLDKLYGEQEMKRLQRQRTIESVRERVEPTVKELGFMCNADSWNGVGIEDPDDDIQFRTHSARKYVDALETVQEVKTTFTARPSARGGEYTPEEMLKYADKLTRAANLVNTLNAMGITYTIEY